MGQFTGGSEKFQLAAEMCKHFPDAPARTLARKLFHEHPGLWSGLEAARATVRTVFGANGNKHRAYAVASVKREARLPGDWRQYIPSALETILPWGSIQIDGPLKALSIADLHVPYHDQGAIELAIEHGIRDKINLLLINGDMMDHYAISRWQTDPRERDFPREVLRGKQMLKTFRHAFPKARIIYKHGNHEERYLNYLRLKAPELLGLPNFEWAEVFGLNEFKIELVDRKRPVRLGHLNVLHGHEYVFAISNPVNPARGLYLRAKAHALCAHFHQTSQHSEKNLEQNVISCWSQGCLCLIHPEYRPLNPWNLGYARIDIDKKNAFHVENLRIIDGKAY
jgi:hypothetical protein